MQLAVRERGLGQRFESTIFARLVNWRGRSGRLYALEPVRLDSFALQTGALHLIALGHQVLWAGSANDVVNDPVSRARFRLALDCADRAFTLSASENGVERLTTIWDLEGAEPQAGLSAA